MTIFSFDNVIKTAKIIAFIKNDNLIYTWETWFLDCSKEILSFFRYDHI